MSDLSLVPTNDMVEEIKRRFNYVIVAAIKELGPATGQQECLTDWKGHVVFCAGIATDLIRDMQDWARRPADEQEQPHPE